MKRRAAGLGEALTVLDRAIAAVSPRWAYNRMRYRLALRAYDAAASGRRTEGWRAGSSSANTELRTGLDRLRYRSRDMCRNVAWAANAVGEYEGEVVGTGVRAQIHESEGLLNASDAKLVADRWRNWAETTECDAEGRHNLYGLQALAMRSIVEGGEVLIRRRVRRASDGLAVPFQLQLLEPDYLDTLRDDFRPSAGPRVVQGIEYSPIGKPTAYYLYREHPGDLMTPSFQSSAVPAQDIVHPFRALRVGQGRGVPWGAPCLLAMRDFVDYGDAVRLRAKIANALVGVIHDISATTDAPILGTKKEEEEEDIRHLEPGTFPVLDPGKTVTFSNPPAPERMEEVARVNLLEIAAGYEVPYERLTGDYANMPFSASRMSDLRFIRRIDGFRWRCLIPQLCTPIWRWFLAGLDLANVINVSRSYVPLWTPQRREMVEPGKETMAIKNKLRIGLSSLFEEIRALGYDPIETLTEIKRSNDLLTKLGIKLDSDPRNDVGLEATLQPGKEQDSEEPEEEPAKKSRRRLNGHGAARAL